MSLDWDTTKCLPSATPQTQEESDIRHALIWATIGLDLGSITEKNLDEWVFRLFHQKRLGLDYINLGTDSPAEVEQYVRRWIGLHCNVTTLSRKKWLARVSEIMEKRTVEQLQYYKQHTAAAV